MSVIVDVHGWDVLVSTADACCIQLLHDVNNGVYIALGYALHCFHQLEQLLLSLCSSVVSCCLSTEPQPGTTSISLPADNTVMSSLSSSPSSLSSSAAVATVPSPTSLDSVAVSSSCLSQLSAMSKSDDRQVDIEKQLATTTLQASVNVDSPSRTDSSCLQQASVNYEESMNIDSQCKTSPCLQRVSADPVQNKSAQTASCHQRLFTRSGRLVKSRKLADFTLSDITFRQTPHSAEKTGLRQHQGQGRRQGQGLGEGQGECEWRLSKARVSDISSSCSDGVEVPVTDVVDTCSNQQQTNDQQADVITCTAAAAAADDDDDDDGASNVTTKHGLASFL